MAFFMAMLYLTEQNRDGVEITPEMIEAGGVALIHSAILSSPYADIDEAVEDVSGIPQMAPPNRRKK